MAANLNDPDPSNDILSPMNVENNNNDESPMYRSVHSLRLRQHEESRNMFRIHRRDVNRISKSWKNMYCKSLGHERRKEFRNVVSRRQMDVDDSMYQKRLRLAAFLGNMDLLMKILRMPNVDVNCVNEIGRSSLFIATKSDRPDMVEELLKHGAAANAPDINGDTPLHSAIQAVNSDHYISIIMLLVQYGALIDIQNNKGKSPLDVLNSTIELHQSPRSRYNSDICGKLNSVKSYLTDVLSAEKQQTRLASNIEQLREVMQTLTTTENSTDTS